MKLHYVGRRLLGELGLVLMEMQSRNSKAVGGRKRLHRVQIEFHTAMVLGLEFGFATGFLAPGFFKSRTLMSLSKQPAVQPSELKRCPGQGLEQPAKQICSSTGLIHHISRFWGLMQKPGGQRALCSALVVHWPGDAFAKADPSRVLNQWELCR